VGDEFQFSIQSESVGVEGNQTLPYGDGLHAFSVCFFLGFLSIWLTLLSLAKGKTTGIAMGPIKETIIPIEEMGTA